MLRALLFDFDGLIVETEKPIYQSWTELFHKYGAELPLSLWVTIIGTTNEPFDPWQLLSEQANAPFDRKVEAEQRRRREIELVEAQIVMPGVTRLLQEARQAEMKTAVVSSSTRRWVKEHLGRLDLTAYFDQIITSDDVTHTKPDPELYQKALQVFNLEPEEAVVFEDSLNGIRAARAAGIYAVAVPNEMTRGLDFSEANLVISSLEQVTLPGLAAQIEAAHGKAG